MLDKFLDILKDGYSIEFSENNTLHMVEITAKKYGKTVSHAINLDHLREFGLKKETTIMVVVQQLIAELDQYKTSGPSLLSTEGYE